MGEREVVVGGWGGGGQREAQTYGWKPANRQTQIYRQTDWQTGRQTGRTRQRERDRQTDWQTCRQAGRQTKTERETDIETD